MKALCSNCDKQPVYAVGLCHACYRYQKRHGVARPAAGIQAAAGPCTDCGRTGPYNDVTLKVCYVCKRYRRTHNGQPRVLGEHGRVDTTKPYNKGPCTNCQRTGWRLTKGLCPACFTYQRHHDHARPVAADGTLRTRTPRKDKQDDKSV